MAVATLPFLWNQQFTDERGFLTPSAVRALQRVTQILGTSTGARTVTAGAGLTGGGALTTDITLAVGAGTGVTVAADTVGLDTTHARNVDHSAVSVLAGSGLTGGGTIEANRTIDVGAGDGISVSANAVALAAGTIVNRTFSEYTTHAAISSTIPADNTIPQNTEGTEILTATITPKSATNRVRITFFGWCSADAAVEATAALFLNTTADALTASGVSIEAADRVRQIGFIHEHSPGAATAQAYKVRVGPSSDNLYMNGTSANRLFGGVGRAILVLEEIVSS